MKGENNPKRTAGFLLVVLYTLWLSAFWGLLALRINAPPDESLPLAMLLAYLTLLLFGYPLLQGMTALYYADPGSGSGASLLQALRRALPRYPPVLFGFATLLGAFLALNLLLYQWLGSDLVSFYLDRERNLNKMEVFQEALVVGVAVSVLIAVLPPIPYPIGLIVALNPSSEFLFSSAAITLIATAIFFLPMMRYVFLLPLVSVYGVTVRDGFSLLHARPFRVWAGQAGGLLTKATGLWIALTLGVFVFSAFMLMSGLLNRLGFGIWWGRWLIPVEMAGLSAIILGPFPGIISVAFQRGRVRTLKRVLGPPALED